MSDARNSSNNLRGGGNKQTGGKGRTTGNAAPLGNDDWNASAGDRGQAAREHMQLKMMAKTLVRKVLAFTGFKPEWKKAKIEMPTEKHAHNRLKGMNERMINWRDKDFKEYWLQRVLEVWVAELKADFAAAQAAQEKADAGDEEGAKVRSCTDTQMRARSHHTHADTRT
jgi:hypothetical protein